MKLRIKKFIDKKHGFERFLVMETSRKWSWKKLWFTTVETEYIVITEFGIVWYDDSGYEIPFSMWRSLERERMAFILRQRLGLTSSGRLTK